MTTTTTFKGVDPNSRNSSRVLRPPGGGSNFSLGFDEPSEQPVRKNKMASSIFGTPEENPPSWAKSAGAKSTTGGREDSESPGAQRSNPSEASSGDFLDLKEMTTPASLWDTSADRAASEPPGCVWKELFRSGYPEASTFRCGEAVQQMWIGPFISYIGEVLAHHSLFEKRLCVCLTGIGYSLSRTVV
ncbi:jupiter microtubule associated homolog 1 isoform X1 [Microtus pennsylvanicus]|uniref:jupiter microtubule associated homolog 1 isoform X1 n=1 Tax=Microtus pennsylvanicus TaxID=10058 RepID=UPI003F6B2FC1